MTLVAQWATHHTSVTGESLEIMSHTNKMMQMLVQITNQTELDGMSDVQDGATLTERGW